MLRFSKQTLFACGILLLCLISCQTVAQVALTDSVYRYTESFNTFSGAGFHNSPDSGMLDSEKWRVRGMSEDMSFGDTVTTGQLASGTAETARFGGIYAFEVDSNDFTLGVQPTGSAFTPGDFTLRAVNMTSRTVDTLRVEYDLYYYNEENRSNAFDFRYSFDDTDYETVNDLSFESPAVADSLPEWQYEAMQVTFTDLDWSEGDTLYIQWRGDDVSGSGGRDMFALNNLHLETVFIEPGLPDALITGTNESLPDSSIDIQKHIAGEDAFTALYWDIINPASEDIELARVNIHAGPQNTISWDDLIDSAYLNMNGEDIITDNRIVKDDEMIFELSSSNHVVPADTTSRFSLEVFFRSGDRTGKPVLQFKIPDRQHGFEANGSPGFSDTLEEAVLSGKYEVETNNEVNRVSYDTKEDENIPEVKPNPAVNREVRINTKMLSGEGHELYVFKPNGELVYRKAIETSEFQLEFAEAGMYKLQIRDDSGVHSRTLLVP